MRERGREGVERERKRAVIVVDGLKEATLFLDYFMFSIPLSTCYIALSFLHSPTLPFSLSYAEISHCEGTVQQAEERAIQELD